MPRLPLTHRRREDEHTLLSLSALWLREPDGVTGMFALGLIQAHGGVQEASKMRQQRQCLEDSLSKGALTDSSA
jgi:hypothetical protein